MTTDDGLKGLTDAQILAFWNAMNSASKFFCSSPQNIGNWAAEHDSAVTKAARQWLADNVHDSGVRALVGKWRDESDKRNLNGIESFEDRDAYYEVGMSAGLKQAADELAAILAEKGEV